MEHWLKMGSQRVFLMKCISFPNVFPLCLHVENDFPVLFYIIGGSAAELILTSFVSLCCIWFHSIAFVG